MKIKINAKNKAVDFRGQEIELSRCGIYLVTGPNGIGKTTILKDLVFSKKFDDHNRTHMSYVEQDPEKYDISVANYIRRFNGQVNEARLAQLQEAFGLTHLDPKASVMTVSGGELVKLNLLAGLCRETDFVFLDEPTNNLDDASAEVLKKTLHEMAETRVVVLVSHDPRLASDRDHTIRVDRNAVTVILAQEQGKVFVPQTKPRPLGYPLGRVIGRHLLRPTTLMSLALLAIYALPILLINHIVFMTQYLADDFVNRDGSLLVYSVDFEYGELSQRYEASQNMKVDEERYYAMLTYKDLPAVADRYDLEAIYIENEIFVSRLWERINQDTLSDSPMRVSIPDAVSDNYMNQLHGLLTKDYLVEGRFPKDGQGEIVLSQGILDREYPGCGVGDNVMVEGQSYRVVGIHYLDLYLVSHTPGETSYFYQYQPETYEAFVAEQTAYKTEVDAGEADRHRPVSLVLKTTPEGEKALLRDLFAQYPANNYRSYSYDRDIADHLNGKLIRGALALNTLTGLALGGLFVLVNRKRRALYETEAVSFDNYYLTRRVTSRVIGLSELALHVLLFLGFVLISPMVLTYEAEVMVTCLNFGLLLAVVSLPAVVGLVKKHG